MEKTLQEASVIELQAAAYQEVVKMNQAQANIRVIEQELTKRNQAPSNVTVPQDVVEVKEEPVEPAQ